MINRRRIGRARMTGTIALLAIAAAGSQYAFAQSEQRPSGADQAKIATVPMNSAPADTATMAVSKPTDTGAAPRPLDRVGLPLTEAQCTGLGGVVTSSISKKCAATGKICFRADQDGVIHSSCITAS